MSFGVDNNSHLKNVLQVDSLNIDKYSSKLMNTCESQVVQYLLNKQYSNSILVCTKFHAGIGQCVFGRSFKKYVDMTVVKDFGKIDIIQYHEKKTHYNLN